MKLPGSFINIALENRLGQQIQLAVQHIHSGGREYVFVKSLSQQVSSLVAKNAEHFAYQLRDIFQLDARRFEMIEVRGFIDAPHLWRWRFEWVGASPISPRCEAISSAHHQAQMLNLLHPVETLHAAMA